MHCREATKLAGRDAQLRLIYVHKTGYALDAECYAFIDYVDLDEAVRSTMECTLAQAAKKVREAGKKVETTILEASGEHIANMIDSDAQRWQADLIVIGTHGRSGISRLFLGSVAEGLVRIASVPVLLLRAG